MDKDKGLEKWTRVAPRIMCKDGVSLSVQVGAHAYCEPRLYGDHVYTHKEVGFIRDAAGDPMAGPESWREYADWIDPEDGITDVYGYVPTELIEEFITLHGGRV